MHEASIIFIIITGTLGLFISGYWRYDIVAALSLFACVLTGVVPFSKAFVGLSNPAVITVACVMIITEAINRSGVMDYVIKRLTPITENIYLHIGSISLLAAILSAFMNNVGALALLMPVAIRTCVKVKRSPSLVLMPLALGSALGGLITSIGTPPNLLIANYRSTVTGQPFAMFDFAPVGIVLAVIGIIFVTLIGWHFIPLRKKSAEEVEDMFHIQDYITEVTINVDTKMVGETVLELETLIEGDVTVLTIIRNQRKKNVFQQDEILRANDVIIIEAGHEDLEKLLVAGELKIVAGKPLSTEELSSSDMAVVEAVIAPDSPMERRSAMSMRFPSRFNMHLIALSRAGNVIKERLHKTLLRAGDVVMVRGPAETLRETVVSLGMLPLVERGVEVGLQKNAFIPLVIFFIAIVMAALGIAPVEIAFAGAVVLLIVFRTIPTRKIYQCIDWPVIILLAAMIPVGGALQTTGGTDLIAQLTLRFAGEYSPILILAILMIVTMTLSDIMNNAATAVVMAPIGVSLAQGLQLNADPFLMAVAVAASCSFLTPIGHQNNILVMGPGGYKFGDYFRVGIILEVIILAVGLPMIVWIWPL